MRAYGAAFRATHAVSHEQARVLRAIAQCRTAALGGHVEQCVSCGTERVCYDSCRNRHCPKCQGSARAKWLAAEQALLLPIPYFHVVFTLPHQLNPLIRVNQRRLYDLLFQTAAQTLQEFARDPTTSGRRNRHYGGSSHLGPDLDRACPRPLRGHGRRLESAPVALNAAPLLYRARSDLGILFSKNHLSEKKATSGCLRQARRSCTCTAPREKEASCLTS